MIESLSKLGRRDFLVFGLGASLGLVLAKWPFSEANSPGNLPVLDQQIDIGYAQSMLQHHQQAIVMASIVASKSRPVVSGLAGRIVQAQTGEIEQLKGWLAALEAPLLPTSGDWMGWMRNADPLLNINERLYLARCDQDPTGMVGLASKSELKKLMDSELAVTSREQHFLQLMIKHHQGAVDMSTLPSRHAATRFIRMLATHTIESQAREINQMNRLLTELG